MQDAWDSLPRGIYKGKHLTDEGHNNSEEKYKSPKKRVPFSLMKEEIISWKYFKVPKNLGIFQKI